MSTSFRLLQCVAYGDALGAPFETPDTSIHPDIASARPGDPFRPTLRLGLAAGGWTDDTAMSVALAEAIVGLGQFDHYTVSHAYHRLYAGEPNRGWGGTLRYALESTSKGPVDLSGRTGWTIGNGALMRSAPLAVVAPANPQERLYLVESDVRITHPHEDVYAAVFVYVTALRARLHDPYRECVFRDAVQDLQRTRISRASYLAVRAAVGLARLCGVDGGCPNDGSVFSTLASVVAAFQSGPAPTGEILHSALVLGGDTDTRLALLAPLLWATSFPRPFTEIEQHDRLARLDAQLAELPRLLS